MDFRVPTAAGFLCALAMLAATPRGVAAQAPNPGDSISARVYGGQPFRLDALSPWRRGGTPFALFHTSRATDPDRYRLKAAPSASDDSGGFLSSLADMVLPVLGITRDQLRDSFGAPRTGHRHRGIDILAPKGTPVLAAVDGAVLKMKWDRGGGRTLRLVDATNRYVFYYAHLSGYARGLREGEPVRKGEVVGYVGRTGDAHGAHLHLGIASLLGDTQHWWQAKQLNPYTLLRHAFGFECDTVAGGRTTTCADDAAGADSTR